MKTSRISSRPRGRRVGPVLLLVLLTALLYPAGIYLACAGIDLLRRRFLERPALRLLAPLTERIDGWLAK